jgi:hypothetical protein
MEVAGPKAARAEEVAPARYVGRNGLARTTRCLDVGEACRGDLGLAAVVDGGMPPARGHGGL